MVSRLFSAFVMLVFLLSASASNTPPSGTYKGCVAEGKGGDSQLNVLKNRAEQVPSPKPMTMAEVLALPVPSGVDKVNRSQWPAGALATVAEHEKEGVIVEGFWIAVTQEGLEATNCEDPKLHDFHLWLVESSAQQKPKSMVTEMTPRWRGSNPGWNQKAIQKLISQGAKFRVTGWLLFDQEHPEQIKRFRATRGRFIQLRKSRFSAVGTGGNYEACDAAVGRSGTPAMGLAIPSQRKRRVQVKDRNAP